MRDKSREKIFYKNLRKASDRDIISWNGGEVNGLSSGTSIFVTRDGIIVDAKRARLKGRTHEDYVWGLISTQLDIDEDDLYAVEIFKDTLRAIDNRGWLRMGTGSNATDNIYYAVLPDYMSFTPTGVQYAEIENFINMAYNNRRSYVIIYFSPYDFNVSKTFFFDDYEPEDIMRIVKRYYSSGRIYEGLKKKRLKEIYPNKRESKRNFTSRFMSATKKEYPDIKQRYAVANSYWGRRDKVNETYGYHYGDLDIARKADRRAIMSDRGTGHFGTGFYMVGTFDPNNAFDYGERACWEIDLDKYNMFKPKSNSQAYTLHDALKEINKGKPKEFPTYEFFDENILQPIYDEYYDIVDRIQKVYNVDYSTAVSMYIDGEYDEEAIIDYDGLEKALVKELEEVGIINYLPHEIDVRRLGQVEDDIKRVLTKQEDRRNSLRWAIRELNKIFNRDVSEEVEEAINSLDQEDSRSTVFMKLLGYEGIDVTHLNKDGEGLRGLDNFAYGSVIYDLKPNTYRKIKEKEGT